MEKRIVREENKKGLGIADIILVAVLLAAGAVLKYFAGAIINIAGMKPNFIIAMYCLAIVLIRPKLGEAAIIGILAGAICQLFPGTPYINLISELLGALVMCLMLRLRLNIGKFSLTPIIATFVSTVVSGGTFVLALLTLTGADMASLYAYIPIVLCTALLNCVIVQALYIPLKAALKKS